MSYQDGVAAHRQCDRDSVGASCVQAGQDRDTLVAGYGDWVPTAREDDVHTLKAGGARLRVHPA